jgi:predicted N-formylglutamate amidohydrolase
MRPFSVINPGGTGEFVLTCEHASNAIPVEYDSLGLEEEHLLDHIAWDIGARHVTAALAEAWDAPAVLAGVSRLLIDCNRDLGDHDLIAGESHGVMIPGNQQVGEDERRHRIRDFYTPYHGAIEQLLAQRQPSLLLSVHSFTPVLHGRPRRFDVGVLFDQYSHEAEAVGSALATAGFRVRYNEPYSALDGLIFSARAHGQRSGVPYLELELNNGLLRDETGARRLGQRVAAVLGHVLRKQSR